MVKLKALTSENFDLFEGIFTPGGSGCYCAVWRADAQDWERRCKDPALPNLVFAKGAVARGAHWGFLAFDENGFVGWTASGPKTEFPLLQTKLASRMTPFVSDIWSIGCIAFREVDLSEKKSDLIIEAVARKASEAGAKFLEAYPTDPWDRPRSYRGSLAQYRKLGFDEFSSEKDGNSRILCMRLKL